MDDRLLSDYLHELNWLRRASGEFARRHPRVAARLRLSEHECPDPHVERLLEGFALQSARLHRRLDDGYGELCGSLLGQLAPHLMRPFPACATALLTPDPYAGSLAGGYHIPAGTPLYALTAEGETVWWRSALEQTLWPVKIADIGWLEGDEARALSGEAQARGALRLTLRCLAPHRFTHLAATHLRIHLCGAAHINAALFDLLHSHVLGPYRPQPVGLWNAEHILPAGEGVDASALALSAWANCPQALMYFDLPLPPAQEEETLALVIPFRRAPQAAREVRPGDIRLGCVPLVNLFTRTSEPVVIDPTRSEHRLIADRHDAQVEIYRVREVHLSHGDRAYPVPPYYAPRSYRDARWFWHARRHRDGDNALWLTLTDSRFDPSAPAAETSLTARLWCSHGQRARALVPGTPLAFEAAGPVVKAQLLETASAPTAPAAQGDARWKLLTSLALNHLSLTDGEPALETLKAQLALYVPAQASPAVWQQINALSSLRCERVSEHRGRDAWRGWRHGIRVTLRLDPQAFTGGSRLLFAATVARYLAHHATANCFVDTVLDDDGEELSLCHYASHTPPIV